MSPHKKERRNKAYTEDELLLGIHFIERLGKITDLLRYFLDKKSIKFTYILMHVDDEAFEPFLREEKRATDILIPLDEKKLLYAVVCQETGIEGGYHFAERIIHLLEVVRQKKCISCNVMTVSAAHYSAEEIAMHLLERYLNFEKESSQEAPACIDFSTLS